MMQTVKDAMHERRRLRNLRSGAPDIQALREILHAVTHDADSLGGFRLRRVLARSGKPNWDAPPQALCLVEEIRRTAEWALRHQARASRPRVAPAASDRRSGRSSPPDD